jgi:hypothetical protein
MHASAVQYLGGSAERHLLPDMDPPGPTCAAAQPLWLVGVRVEHVVGAKLCYCSAYKWLFQVQHAQCCEVKAASCVCWCAAGGVCGYSMQANRGT